MVFTTAGYDIKLEVYAVLHRLNLSTKPGLSLGFLYEKEEGVGCGRRVASITPWSL